VAGRKLWRFERSGDHDGAIIGIGYPAGLRPEAKLPSASCNFRVVHFCCSDLDLVEAIGCVQTSTPLHNWLLLSRTQPLKKGMSGVEDRRKTPFSSWANRPQKGPSKFASFRLRHYRHFEKAYSGIDQRSRIAGLIMLPSWRPAQLQYDGLIEFLS